MGIKGVIEVHFVLMRVERVCRLCGKKLKKGTRAYTSNQRTNFYCEKCVDKEAL